jgi:hypothetical protein
MISVANFSWRVNHVKHGVALCLQNMCFLNFDLGVAAASPIPRCAPVKGTAGESIILIVMSL